jgi:hypothetical protein
MREIPESETAKEVPFVPQTWGAEKPEKDVRGFSKQYF